MISSIFTSPLFIVWYPFCSLSLFPFLPSVLSMISFLFSLSYTLFPSPSLTYSLTVLWHWVDPVGSFWCQGLEGRRQRDDSGGVYRLLQDSAQTGDQHALVRCLHPLLLLHAEDKGRSKDGHAVSHVTVMWWLCDNCAVMFCDATCTL